MPTLPREYYLDSVLLRGRNQTVAPTRGPTTTTTITDLPPAYIVNNSYARLNETFIPNPPNTPLTTPPPYEAIESAPPPYSAAANLRRHQAPIPVLNAAMSYNPVVVDYDMIPPGNHRHSLLPHGVNGRANRLVRPPRSHYTYGTNFAAAPRLEEGGYVRFPDFEPSSRRRCTGWRVFKWVCIGVLIVAGIVAVCLV